MGNAAYKKRHKELGLCRNCSEPVYKNSNFCKKHCFEHAEKAGNYYKDHKEKVLIKLSVKRLLKELKDVKLEELL